MFKLFRSYSAQKQQYKVNNDQTNTDKTAVEIRKLSDIFHVPL